MKYLNLKLMTRLAVVALCLLFCFGIAEPVLAQQVPEEETSETKTEKPKNEDETAIWGDSTFMSNTVVCGNGVAQTTGPTTGGLASGSKLYILGDSITARTASLYKSGFEAKGITTDISARVGRSWTSNGQQDSFNTGSQGTGKEAVEADKTLITAANGIMVALGTNGYITGNPVDDIITTIRTHNPTAPIWWVNVANGPSGNTGTPEFNTILQQAVTAGKIQIVPWATAVDPTGDGTNNPGGVLDDGTHPSIPAGTQKLADLAVATVTGNAPPANAGTQGQTGCQCPAGGTTVASNLPPAVPEPHRSLFTEAAASTNVNPQFIAALFLSEQGNVWKPFDSPWASSPVGASGPFQFMPGTWSGYATDGDGDGTADIMNIKDAAFAAAKLVATNTDVSTPLGNLEKPYAPGTILYSAAAYNWGGGNLQSKTNPDSPLSAGPQETQNYLINVFSIINSGFTKSDYANYGNPRLPDGASVTGEGSSTTPNVSCGSGGGIVGGNIVETAVGLAWDRNVGDSAPPFEKASTTAYQAALKKFSANGNVGGDIGYTDCGRFVGTVMEASGVDPDYPDVGTWIAADYVRSHPEKYEIIENVTDTSQLKPGDILIDGPNHTYIYVGAQPNGFDIREASYGSRVPQSRKFWVNAGAYFAARYKG